MEMVTPVKDKDPEADVEAVFARVPANHVDFVLVWESSKPAPPSNGNGNGTRASSGSGSGQSGDHIDGVGVTEVVVDNGQTDADVVDGKRKEREALENAEKRRVFEKNLEAEGLILDHEDLEGNASVHFVKIYTPIQVLRRYAEILRLRMPMKEELTKPAMEAEAKQEAKRKVIQRGSSFRYYWKAAHKWMLKQIQIDPAKFPPTDQRLSAIYSRDKEYLFDIHEPDFFSQEIRGQIVDFILKRKRYSEDSKDEFSFGITKLINEKAYTAAYPLHDGDLRTPGSCRNLLATEWASLKKLFKQQPLDAIKEYFGVNIGLYYAWLGFYTQMLIFATILGFFCIFYGFHTLKDNKYSQDICNNVVPDDMCPLCNKGCDYWTLNSTCTYSRVTYIFDNNFTVVFAVLMSFWAAIFLEFWKRYSSEITYKWDLTSIETHDEPPRVEYLTTVAKIKKLDADNKSKAGGGGSGAADGNGDDDTNDILTLDEEPHVSFWKTKLPLTLFSLSTVFLMITMAGAVLVAIITYRTVSSTVIIDTFMVNRSRAMIIVSATAACLNLVMISIFNYLYTFVAQYLTELELHRTQTEFDASLTLKIYLLQFINFYSSLFYIAFFKGRFIGTPKDARGVLTQEECGPAGCMTELFIQLTIIMIGKQFVNAVMEMTGPLVKKWVRYFRIRSQTIRESRHSGKKVKTQWGEDLKLLDWQPRELLYEYLEMVLQYGFITIFVAAFPIAPFFALLNNVLEMRLDGTKMLVYNRRPVGQRTKDIGIWYDILHTVSKIAVISNAFIIAFTSNFIPKLVYKLESQLGNGTLDGYLKYSLTSFNTTHFTSDTMPTTRAAGDHPDHCMYQNYHYSHTWADPDKHYTPTWFYWKVLFARLLFVVIFENFVSLCVLLLKGIIPDVPKKLKKRIRLENNLVNDIIMKEEMKRAREELENNKNGLGTNSGGDSSLRGSIRKRLGNGEGGEFEEIPV